MYTIKLTQYAFDNTYTNARLFDNKAERDAYFENLQGYTFNKDVNFIARDIIATDIDIKVEPQAPLFTLLNYNYCIVKNETETLYFYIRKSEQLSANLIRCRLENDIIQNYLYDTEFSDCMITKAHLNRFIDNGDGTVSFDGSATSKLFEREELKDVSKRLLNRQKLLIHQDLAENSDLNKWLYDNVIAWCYMSISQGTYKTGTGETEETTTYVGVKKQQEINSQINYGNSLFCFPITKQDYRIYIKDIVNTEHLLSADALTWFLGFNNGFANVFSLKLSIKPPFDLKEWATNEYTINNNKLTINANYQFTENKTMTVGNHQEYWAFGPSGFLNIKYDDPTPIKATLYDTNILPKLTFDKTDIIDSNRNIIYNPKLNNSDYKSLQLTFAGNSYEYDIQKLNDANPEFEYYEMLTSDITKALLQYKPKTDNNIFNINYGKSFNGFTYTNDLSIPFAKGVDDQYFANNKNAFLSFQNTQTLSNFKFGVQTVKGLASSIASMSPSNIAQFGIGLGASMVEHAVQLQYEQAQFNLSIDNMRSAPETLANINGNAILISSIAEFGIYIEIYEAIPNELEIANNITYDKGFVYNQYDNIKNHINTRKYFNYIQANIENIQADLSNDIKLRMRQIFANGIKFWHTDDIIFNKENYERSLEANG